MVDVDTFLTALYVMVDNFCQSRPPKRRPGPEASLSDSEVITLAIFARWGRFSSERDFYRYARRRLRDAFPTLPDRSQFNRLVRSCAGLIEEVALHLALVQPDARGAAYTRLWIPRPCPFATRSEGARDGWPATPTSGGPIAWGGTKAFACSSPSTLRG